MGIQINGQTDTISAGDGSLVVNGAELPTVGDLNVTGVSTFSGNVILSGGDLTLGTGVTVSGTTQDVLSINTGGSAVAVAKTDTGLTGSQVERYFPVLAEYFNVTNTWEPVYNYQFNTSTAVMNETGDYLRMVFPTCHLHKKVISAKLIFHGAGTVGGNPWTVTGDMYRAASGQGYTSDGTTFSFNIPSISNGKVYSQDITSVFPELQQGHINSLQLTFTENIGGTTVFVAGLQLVEATYPVT
jgi:hypothetical protein